MSDQPTTGGPPDATGGSPPEGSTPAPAVEPGAPAQAAPASAPAEPSAVEPTAPTQATPASAPVEPKKPGRFGRAEGASRRAVLFVGSGVLAYVLGGFVMAGLIVRIAERVGGLSTPIAAWTLEWILIRTWLWAVLPVFGWAAGRYLEVTPARFTLTAVVSGELFGLALATASDGIEWVLRGPADMVMRVVTLVAGGVLVAAAVKAGIAGADAAQQAANVEAEKRKAEYAEFLAKAEGRGEK